ncbi:MAG: GTP-binding protein [Clostridiales bacterium]|nr:GTP-binding protein [Clostridiales bacterium]
MNGLLKFITCGSVDDGKSTLIGHMLYDAKLLFADQARSLELESKVGSRGGKIDYSLLLDGLMAEREQGITIDVAYRYFTTERRSFIVADTPGHEEYTRNMAVGASFADLAVILVDASQGVLVQTRRHARICSLMGIRHFVFAVNKMDLTGYSQSRFEEIAREIDGLIREFHCDTVKIIPVSATEGDNITKPSVNMPWYHDGTLLSFLETVDVSTVDSETGFTMPVQRVCRPDRTFRGFQGQIASGQIQVGDEVTALPSMEQAKVTKILNAGAEASSAAKGQAVTLQLDREVDISRGCVLACGAKPYLGDQIAVRLLWMDDEPLAEGKNYLLRIGTQKKPAIISNIQYKIDVNTGERIPADTLSKNELAACELVVSEKVVFDLFDNSQDLGSLILIDRVSHMTSACGVVTGDLTSRSEDTGEVTPALRASQKGQRPKTVWFQSGSAEVARRVEKHLFALGRHTMTLDGNSLAWNANRLAETARLMNQAGLIVLVASRQGCPSDDEAFVVPARGADPEEVVKLLENN